MSSQRRRASADAEGDFVFLDAERVTDALAATGAGVLLVVKEMQ